MEFDTLQNFTDNLYEESKTTLQGSTKDKDLGEFSYD